MYCMSKATGDPERAINGFMSVAQLLEEPRLARLYTYMLREGEVTIGQLPRGQAPRLVSGLPL
jgi:hypothetical protein